MADAATRIDAVLAQVDAQIDASLSRLAELVAIPSISTDPAYKDECRRAADWLVADLQALGFEVSARPTPGHPVVVGHQKGSGKPRVLFYGHYDVQPVDPLELWHSDPFEMTTRVVDGRTRLFGRGTSDDKGQVMTFIEACRAYKAATGSLPVDVCVLIEGEEESGGKNLPGFIESAADELKADIALVCDTDMWDAETPSITTMLRGLVGEEIEITCASKDLHSGMYGNAARNPIQVLAEIVASLRRPDGGVALPGFYDGVPELPAEVARDWDSLGFDTAQFLGEIGLRFPAGEQGRSALEQIWARPTCEINGISGGYEGDGFKTVIPARASAKISFRLVGNQDPHKIREAFRAHVRAMLPPDCSVTFKDHGAGPAISVPADGHHVQAALDALSAEWGKKAVITGSGGSIPVVGEIKRLLGMNTLLIGFAQLDDAIHSPNEKYDLESFHKGIRSWVRVLAALSE
ncbi:MAG TPA: dipeptidase [Devosiaceae bacterium]